MIYIVVRGTVGGCLMDFAFALYGLCVLLCALQTVRRARQREMILHREWALRLFVLAIGSLLYRVHYGIWYELTGGIGMAPRFSGPFDQFQNFAFFVPYLLLVELYVRIKRDFRPLRNSRSNSSNAGL